MTQTHIIDEQINEGRVLEASGLPSRLTKQFLEIIQMKDESLHVSRIIIKKLTRTSLANEKEKEMATHSSILA